MSSLKLKKGDDPCQRSTKKVKTKGSSSDTETETQDMATDGSEIGAKEVVVFKAGLAAPSQAPSYKTSLLKTPGSFGSEEFQIPQGDRPEDSWFEHEKTCPLDSYDPCPDVEVSQEELEAWHRS
ncbi:hypothetical protein SESBI_46255 [Sesbania bispinosa]|nr:hypothetical protein SESBI_46255 [Sesbania bispinosa]